MKGEIGGMNEHRTNTKEVKTAEEIYSGSKVSDIKGVGKGRKRSNNSREISDTSEHTLRMAEGIGKRSCDIFKLKASAKRSPNTRIRKREPEVKRDLINTDSRVDVVKKKDEFGLSNRKLGFTYAKDQKELIIKEVARLKSLGISKTKALNKMGVCRSTYYSWFKNKIFGGKK